MHFTLLGCNHNWSRVFTLKDRNTGVKRTYKVCLDCGKERDYDLEDMCFAKSPASQVKEEVEVCA